MEREGLILITESVAGVFAAGLIIVLLLAIAFSQEEDPQQEMAEKLEEKEKQLKEKEDKLKQIEEQLRIV
jgi:septal ring factor EnvC (AmiA/AmiB activator)